MSDRARITIAKDEFLREGLTDFLFRHYTYRTVAEARREAGTITVHLINATEDLGDGMSSVEEMKSLMNFREKLCRIFMVSFKVSTARGLEMAEDVTDEIIDLARKAREKFGE